MARLIVSPRSDQPVELQLNPGSNYIGRSPDNDFSVEDDSLSDLHCEIVVGNDSVLARDLGSTNGSFVDGEQITEKTLRSGQMLQLGSVEMLFQDDPVAAPLPVVAETAAVSRSLAASMRPGRSVELPTPPPASGIAGEGAVIVAPEPPRPRPIPGGVPIPSPAGKSVCKFHPKSAARWLCPQCGRSYCDLCVSSRMTHEGPLHLCRTCGVGCQPLQPPLTALGDEEPDFLPAMLRAFTYPFQGDGWILMILGSLFFWFTNTVRSFGIFGMFAIFGVLIVAIFGGGYLFAYMMRIITSTANGEKHMPDWPDFGDWGDIIGPLLQGLCVILACFIIPIWAASLWAVGNGLLRLAVAFILGCFYFPMAFLAVAMFDSVMALNPMLIIPSIARVWKEYLFACAVLLVIVVVRSAIAVFFAVVAPIPVLPNLISGFFGFYFLTVEMRILGALYRTRRNELAWFSAR